MQQNPLISVVMPVHNAGEYLPAAVESILLQNYPHLELIIVDDHSTDNAIENIQGSDPRINIISCHKRGVVHAMQQGAQLAKGDYIARMDADDIALPERLRVQREYLLQHPDVGIVAAQVEIFSDDKVGEGYQVYQQWLNSVNNPEQIRRELFIESPLPNPTVMFPRNIYQQLGGYHDIEWAEDYDCWLRADALNIRMGKPEGILLRWRHHANRLTHNDERYSQHNFLRAKAHYLAQSRIHDREVIIWGAGTIGADFCDLLQQQGVRVKGFIDVNPRYIGNTKRNLPVWSMELVDNIEDEMIIGAVGSRGARAEIRRYLEQKGLQEGESFIFVA